MPAEAVQQTVLIVDDDPLNRLTLAGALEAECRVLMARDGASALSLMAREQVQLVLLDVVMPDMDGYEVLRRMKAQPALRDVPVIFITAMSDAAEEERGLLRGASDYVSKPARPAVVRARVLTHLKLYAQRRALEALAVRDGLTGIANRRAFDSGLEQALRRCARTGESLALAMFDVDYFKQFNDIYGHGAGDAALRRVAELLASLARRDEDLVARYGGEEFVMMMPGCDIFAPIMESARARIAAAAIPHLGAQGRGHLTISGGGVVAMVPAVIDSRALLRRADEMLYLAKANGRDRIELHNDQTAVAGQAPTGPQPSA